MFSEAFSETTKTNNPLFSQRIETSQHASTDLRLPIMNFLGITPPNRVPDAPSAHSPVLHCQLNIRNSIFLTRFFLSKKINYFF